MSLPVLKTVEDFVTCWHQIRNVLEDHKDPAVENFVKNLKPLESNNPKLFHDVMVAIGLFQYKGQYTWVDSIRAAIDNYIVPIIVLMNEKGLRTISCCSGIVSEHNGEDANGQGYVFFECKGNTETLPLFKTFCEDHKMMFENCTMELLSELRRKDPRAKCDRYRFVVRLFQDSKTRPSDDETKQKWALFQNFIETNF